MSSNEGAPDRAGLPARIEEHDEAQRRVDDAFELRMEKSRFIQPVDYEPYEPMPVVAEHRNVGQERVETTVEKIRAAIGNHVDRREIRFKWFGAATVALTFFIAILAGGFRDFVISAQSWEGALGVLAGLATLYIVWNALAALTAPTRKQIVEDIVYEITHGERPIQARKRGWRRRRG